MNRCHHHSFLIVLLGSIAFSTTAVLGDGTDRPQVIVEAAEEAYRRGVEGINGSTTSQAAFEESATLWRKAISDGADGASAWFNLGNALLRGDRIGQAIVAYRRAERLSPSSDDVAANLAEARRRVDRPIEADATDLDFTGVSAWWDPIPGFARLVVAVIAWFTFWILLFLRSDRSREDRQREREFTTAAWRSGLVASVAIALVAGATIAGDLLLPGWRPVGVVITDDATLRSGNGEGFEPATTEPLAAGVEFAILENRPGWWRIRLPDGTSGWISNGDAESVDPT